MCGIDIYIYIYIWVNIYIRIRVKVIHIFCLCFYFVLFFLNYVVHLESKADHKSSSSLDKLSCAKYLTSSSSSSVSLSNVGLISSRTMSL